MAKSRKTPPRKKTGAKPSPSKVLDAEVVLPEAEPQDYEVEDSPLDPAALKELDEAEAVLAKAEEEAKDTVVDTADDAKDAADDAKKDVAEAVTDAAADAKDAVTDNVDDLTEAADAKIDEVTSDIGDAAADGANADTANEIAQNERPAAVAADPEPAMSGGMFGSIVGGVIAGGIGFGIAMLVFPEGWREKDDSLVTSLQEGLGEQVEKVTALTGQVGDIDGKLGELGGRIESEIGSLKDSVAEGMAERGTEIAAVADRLQRLTEGEGMVALPDDVQLLLNAQKERIAELSENVAGMAANAKAQMEAALAEQETAEEAEARVKARGALQAVRLALVSGEPFAEALDEISPATEVPAGLSAVAADGVPTVAALVGSYPDLARQALAVASREAADGEESTGNRLGNFFKDQLNARSLTPQEGDSADAVLSRVEAAVKAEDLETALSEIDGLADAPKEVFADWTAQAEARQAAVNGYEAVSDALNGN